MKGLKYTSVALTLVAVITPIQAVKPTFAAFKAAIGTAKPVATKVAAGIAAAVIIGGIGYGAATAGSCPPIRPRG